MIIKLLWLGCSVIVFRHALTAFIKSEMEDFGELDVGLLCMFIFIAFGIAVFGPIAILAYIGYNVLEGIVQAINERYKSDSSPKKSKDNEWRYKSDPR
jgi:hypothetical protein